MCRDLDIDVPGNVVPQIAFGFGGGIGNTGSVCGALAGAIMAVGLKRGRPDSMEGALSELGVSGELRRRFEAEMGAVDCYELTAGADLTSPEGIADFMKSGVPERVCRPAVRVAYDVAMELLGGPAVASSADGEG